MSDLVCLQSGGLGLFCRVTCGRIGAMASTTLLFVEAKLMHFRCQILSNHVLSGLAKTRSASELYFSGRGHKNDEKDTQLSRRRRRRGTRGWPIIDSDRGQRGRGKVTATIEVRPSSYHAHFLISHHSKGNLLCPPETDGQTDRQTERGG